MNTEQLRAEFEAWHKREMWDGGYESGHDEFYTDAYRFNERRVYENMHTQIAWRGYQAGRAALQTQDREDAERYRALRAGILRSDDDMPTRMAEYAETHFVDMGNPTTAEIDAAIDHARRVEGGGE